MSDTFPEMDFPETEPPYWLVARSSAKHSARDSARELETFTLDFGGERVLPMFRDRAQAERFIQATGLGSYSGSLHRRGWELRPCSGGELVSLLSRARSGMSPCAGVSRVAFDPPAVTLDGASIGLLSISRESFIDYLLGRGRSWFENRQKRTTQAEQTQTKPEIGKETL